MKYYLFSLLLLFYTVSFCSTPIGSTVLTGKVTDKETKQTIPGVTIYIPDLKTGTVTGADGTYKIEQLPQTKLLFQISFLGYGTITEIIDLSVITSMDFELQPAVKEIKEIVVTGLSQAGERNRTPTPIQVISPVQLMQNTNNNIIDAIAKQPGISQISSGVGISKPVIRGLGFNRVVVVNDGIRQEGQQWGDEHGIEIDEFSVNRIEILKGPASLSYGSDAIAGVINMLSAPTLPTGNISGNFINNYQTNNGLIANSANIAGNIKGYIWDIRYSHKTAHDYKNKYDGYVFNSRYKEQAVTGIAGINKSWGYSHIHLSAYTIQPGIVEGERDSLSGQFVKEVAVNDTSTETSTVQKKEFYNHKPYLPFQLINHYKAVWNTNLIIGDGSLKTTVGFQQNRRKEFDDILNPEQYGLYFLMNTINYDIRYTFPQQQQFNLSLGINGMQQHSQNKGSEFLIPEYQLFDIGLFAILKKSFNKLDISGGVRYDIRNQRGEDLFINEEGSVVSNSDTGAFHLFKAFHNVFSGFSGSIGATYQLNNDIYIKLNAARGYRAPNISELASNGQHEGTLRYEIGNSNLQPETSLQLDAALGINTEHISFELDLFNNRIQHFIFSEKLNSLSGSDSLTEGYATFHFVSGKATMLGGEVMMDIHPHPLDWLHFENSFSYVQAIQQNQPDSMRYLPLTPAPKLFSELRADIKLKNQLLSNSFIKLEMEHYMAQNKIYTAFSTETKTPGYTLFHVGIGTSIHKKNKPVCTLYLSVNNITNVAYQNHLSRLKYAPVNYLTKREGVYGMGRNISIKLIIPFRIYSH